MGKVRSAREDELADLLLEEKRLEYRLSRQRGEVKKSFEDFYNDQGAFDFTGEGEEEAPVEATGVKKAKKK